MKIALERLNLLLMWCILASFLAPESSFGSILDLTYQEMRQVVKLARSINVVQPLLKDTKYMEFALGIYRASQKYDLDPAVLIAITQQETGFRENLPEGRAGEIGVCQIRRVWLNNPKFRAEFKKATVEDLNKPAKSFMFAAWILRNLKDKVKAGSLPFWSYYNAVKFENRFKYFISVNKKIVALRRHEPFYVERYPASEEGFVQLATYSPQRTVAEFKNVDSSETIGVPTRKPQVLADRTERVSEPKTKIKSVPGSWVSDALSKVKSFPISQKITPRSRFSNGKKIGWEPLIIEAKF